MTTPNTDRLRKLAAEATPGPWVAKTCEPCAESGVEDVQIWDERGRIPIAQWMDDVAPDAGADAEFIAAAREAVPALLDRVTRLEAQAAIRGRAVVIYQARAREAEAERDWNLRSSRLAKEGRIKANARADRAEAKVSEEKVLRMKAVAAVTEAEAGRDEWRQIALDERAAALDALEQIKVRDARIKAVEDVLDRSRDDITMHTYPEQLNADIRRALDP